jgi:hypothetical protein
MQGAQTVRTASLFVAGVLACALPGSAQMAVGVAVGELGILTCALEREDARESNANADGRLAICEFHPRSGVPETYSALLRTVRRDNRLPNDAETMMLVVKGPYSMRSKPGMLEQSYGAEDTRAADKNMPLAGEKNTAIVLHPEAKATEPTLALGQPKPGTLIRAVLKLRSSNT